MQNAMHRFRNCYDILTKTYDIVYENIDKYGFEKKCGPRRAGK